MRFSHRGLACVAGTLWLMVGLALLGVGLLLVTSLPVAALAAAAGYAKGRFVMARAARKQVTRICGLTEPASLKQLYSWTFYLLIACMMGMGMALRHLPVPVALRAFIDMAVGIALVIGSVQYYSSASRISNG